MKNILSILLLSLITTFVNAQAPESFKYQSVVRDGSGNVITNQNVGFQISILQTSATGVLVYMEQHNVTTNNFGLANLNIGAGTVVSGNFTTIDWGADTYFVKIEIDETGGTNYQLMGTSQLLSVPYALHAKTAENVTGTINYTETDPVFVGSIANGITAVDTANWNNHTVDTDTHIDSMGITNLGFVSGTHTIDTQIDSLGIANLGYVAGNHTVDTDTHIDSIGITNLGFVSGNHTIDTQIDSLGIANYGFMTNFNEVDGDSTNELQALSISNDTIFLSNGGFVKLPNNSGPTGTIVAFVGVSAPNGWKICDGAELSRSLFVNLFSIIDTAYGNGNGSSTFNIPDLRGVFLRGFDNGAGRDPNANSRTSLNGGAAGDNLGSYQVDMFKSHNHYLSGRSSVGGGGNKPSVTSGGISNVTIPMGQNGGAETRPKNIYVNYIIKL